MAHPPSTPPCAPPPADAPTVPSPHDVAAAALACFASLPRTGKPQPHEHTVLAAILLSRPAPRGPPELRVAALATGTKCLGASARYPGGAALNDCHAEVLARRAFLLFLHAHARALVSPVAAARDAVNPLGREEEGTGEELRSAPRLRLRPGIGVHLYVSQPPCGDACVIAGDQTAAGAEVVNASSEDMHGDHAGALERREDVQADHAAMTGPSLPRTGAKLLGSGLAAEIPGARDPAPAVVLESYGQAQAVGRLRRKPGRGEGTLSMSCSDKLARWRLLGLQGGLWSGLLAAPLALDSVTVHAPRGADADATLRALRRAVVERVEGAAATLDAAALPPPPALRTLPAAAAAEALGLAPSAARRSAAGGCLLWHALPGQRAGGAGVAGAPRGALEGLTGVLGLRSGHKRRRCEDVKPGAASAASKLRLGRAFVDLLRILQATPLGLAPAGQGAAPALLSYGEVKRRCGERYRRRWAALRQHALFSHWIPKPPDEFHLDVTGVTL